MCSRLLQKMENYQGDLTDILRASGGGGSMVNDITQAEVVSAAAITDWQFPSNSNDFLHMTDQETVDEFGDPFSNLRDPLLDMSSSGLFTRSTSTSSDIIRPSTVENIGQTFSGGERGGGTGGAAAAGGNSMIVTQRVADEEIIRRPSNNNIFSRMLQISPNAKLPVSSKGSQVVAVSPLVTNEMINTTTMNSSKCSLVENGGMQISSPRNTGMKRRKSQAKKVVCIPAPAPASSRPSGEIVPSDLWAWRKYGQKPIKGSPYPRGYYRCSSSKGCSARKQVERSRTDPNMLVITYTSEHNHPWPTQRNALAGSTRNQPVKSGSSSKTTQSQKSTNLKEEEKESGNDNASSSPTFTPNLSIGPLVKEEMEDHHDHKQMEMDDVQFNEGFQQSYKPALPDSNHTEDFFADLGELEADPLNLLFTQGYSGDHEEQENKNLDPFSFYDWANNTTTSTITTINKASLEEEVKKGL